MSDGTAPDHPELAIPLNNLGNVWTHLDQPRKAVDLYERALTISEREFGPDHPEVTLILLNLGVAWAKLNEPRKAQDMFQRALTIQRVHYPDGNPYTELLIDNLRRVAPDLIVLNSDKSSLLPRNN